MTVTDPAAEPSAAADTPLEQRRQLLTEIPGPRSAELLARQRTVVAAGVGATLPVYVERASGAILRDVDGNQFIDLASGIAVTSVGHAAPQVVSAVRDQVGKLTHTCAMVTPYAGYVEVCEQLADLIPGRHEKKSVLVNSGAEAVENAIKIARYATGRSAVVTLDHAYHGRTNLTMALTAKAAPYKRGFGPFAPDIYRVAGSYPYRDGLSGEAAAARFISQIEVQIGADQTACVLIEPIQGEGGFIVPAPGFLPAVSQWCTDNGIVFIADEIQAGFCRTGQWFAIEHEGVVPDLVTTAKGIAGGLPLAAVTGRADLMDAVHGGGLGGTYGGNPVSCAAALATIGTMREHDLPAAARRIGEIAFPLLTGIAERTGVVGEVRGRGAMLAIELVKRGTTEPDAALAKRAAATCHANGVITLSCGTYGNVIRLLPPLVIDEALLREGLDVLADAVAAAAD